jgi:hypothetical protein
MRKLSRVFAVALATAMTAASAEPVLQQVTPLSTSYLYSTDFFLVTGTGTGNVTAPVYAVDLKVPSVGGSTSGCEAADFAGFTVGAIALIQRGTCQFLQKVDNAEAAGAAAVLFFNEGNSQDRLGAISVTLGIGEVSTLPVLFTSFDIGMAFSAGITNGLTNTTGHIAVTSTDLAVPEPTSLALAILALGTLGLFYRRHPSTSNGN